MEVKIYNPVYTLQVTVEDIQQLDKLRRMIEREGFQVKVIPDIKVTIKNEGDW